LTQEHISPRHTLRSDSHTDGLRGPTEVPHARQVTPRPPSTRATQTSPPLYACPICAPFQVSETPFVRVAVDGCSYDRVWGGSDQAVTRTYIICTSWLVQEIFGTRNLNLPPNAIVSGRISLATRHHGSKSAPKLVFSTHEIYYRTARRRERNAKRNLKEIFLRLHVNDGL
jgi:hypothetical protein